MGLLTLVQPYDILSILPTGFFRRLEYTVQPEGCLCDGTSLIDADRFIRQGILRIRKLLPQVLVFPALFQKEIQQVSASQPSQFFLCHADPSFL